ncbi:unnamed protein product [Closterium sp. NIES-54]
MDRFLRLSPEWARLGRRLPDGREAVAHQHRDGRGQGGERAGEVRARLRLRRHHRHRCQPWIHSQVVPNPEKTYKLHISKGTFILKQVHVHSFSEHAVNGLFAAMEAHFVHQHENDNTSLAVVGVMIRLQRHDEKSDWIDVWQSKVPAGVDTNTTIDVPQNFWMEMIDPSMGFWRYSGSLTTPACSEIVEWHVLRKAKFLSVAQAITFMNLIAKQNTERTDNRLPEPLNGRTVTYFTNVSA